MRKQAEIRKNFSGRVRAALCAFVFASFFLTGGVSKSVNPSYAQCASCGCVATQHNITRGHVSGEHTLTRIHIARELDLHREEFIIKFFFRGHVLPAMMMMTEQLTATAMAQMNAIGMFFDARNQIQTQQLIQELTAKAHKDYQPSMQMCTFGTLSTSLANSKRVAEINHFALSQQIQDRQSLHNVMASAGGGTIDVLGRWQQFRERFCDPRDNNDELSQTSGGEPPLCAAVDGEHVNRDVDYTRTIDYPKTLKVNFTSPGMQADEEKVIAMASYLYGHDVPQYQAEALIENDQLAHEMMRTRGFLAKRSVAQNSFSALVGLKSEGPAATFALRRDYMSTALEQLGITDVADVNRILYVRPSYYAQMELLSKGLYQMPQFYTNLYDKPANVDRVRASMRAIGLMQKMDNFKSRLRSEAALAVLAETYLTEDHRRIQDNLMSRTADGVR
jgi:hypothetical protein